MSAERDQLYLGYLLEGIEQIEALAAPGRAPFEASRPNHAHAVFYLRALSHCTRTLSEPLKAAHPEVDWMQIMDFNTRPVIREMTRSIDFIWNLIENTLPDLKVAVLAIRTSLDNSEAG